MDEKEKISVLFYGVRARWEEYAPYLRAAFEAENIAVRLENGMRGGEVEYIIYCPEGGKVIDDFSCYPNLKAVHGTWAGVETIVSNPSLKVPFARMVDPGMSVAMTAWVMGHILRYHGRLDTYILAQNGTWNGGRRPHPKTMIWTVLGQGVLGRGVAEKIADFGFQARIWGRTGGKDKEVAAVQSFYGTEGLKPALSGAHGVVLLLPQTPETQNIIGRETLSYLARGAFLINVGRGGLVDDDALIDALNTDQLAHASLDVFRTEPLPPENAFWRHPKITVTPHVAAETYPDTAATVIAQNIARVRRGEEMDNLVIPARGY